MVTELNIKMNVMMQILMMVMDATVLAKFNQDGHVKEDHQGKKAYVINLSQIKLY